jgi:predicted ATPase/Flp pilus assembly protein TadD
LDFVRPVIEAARVPPAAPRRKLSLTLPASRFIGRGADLAELARIFGEGRRLVTIWGTAGMGKTRLARELAVGWALARPDEQVCFCELEAARDLGAFCGAVARALGVAVAAGKKDAATAARIGRALAGQGPMLLVLDNLEQVIQAAAPALDAWVREAPEVRFLITSRERSRLPGEVSYELGPLSLPEADDGAAASEAVELFLDRVRTLSPGASPGAEALPKVASLVRKLEGIPLAIELAAARADVLGLDALHARLARRLDLLAGGRRGVEARQATLRSAVEWSWDLLDEDDRRALARGSVFRGGFSLAAADAVLGEPGSEALDRVQSLRDKSLLRAAPRVPGGPVRFSLYEGVRELAAEKLAERGEGALAEGRHAAYFLAEGEAAARAWETTGAVDALDRIGDDLENLLAVVEGALARGAGEEGLRALLVIDPVLSTRGPFGTHLDLLDRALALGADPLLEARALAARGRARHLRGNDEGGLEDLEAARVRARALGAAEIEAGILTDVGVIHHLGRALDEAQARYEEALALYRRAGARRAEGRVLGNLGALLHDQRRFDEAMRHYEPALAIAAAAGDLRTEGIFGTNVGLLEQERGAAVQAGRRYERAVAILEEVGDLRLLAISLGSLGTLHHEEGRIEEARAYHERAAALLHEVGDSRSEARAWGRLGAALASLGRLEDARAALARGERLILHAGDAIGTELLGVARGFLDLALARAARVESRPEEAAVHLADLRRRIGPGDGAPSLADRSDDIRLYLRMLDRGLSAMDAGAVATGAELLLAPGGRWCRPPGGAWQDLRERHAVRRLLVCLVEGRRDAPGRGVSLDALREAGWPGERMLPQAAQNRIYVAVNQLRKLGLKDLLQRGSEGYFLDPALPVHYTGVEPTSV